MIVIYIIYYTIVTIRDREQRGRGVSNSVGQNIFGTPSSSFDSSLLEFCMV